ncbi:MAG: hypothetical protein K9I36_09055 [Bacteroidia bacterium]|nr:hypothetical protein [Bacteroidia bacterium]MCF8426866.1 hypothetical protein [Bacteroidia bacterium]
MESINQGENVFSCYIIFSMTLNKYFIGITSEGAQNRLIKHNTSADGNSFTSKTNSIIFPHYNFRV